MWLVAPLQVRYTPRAEVWPISVGALALAPFDGEISITGVRCGENEIPFVIAEGSSSRVPKVTVPGATKKALDRWMRLREKALAGLAPAEEAEFSNLSELLRAASIDTPPTWLYLETASFPFEVADQQDYPITLSMDVAGTPREVTVLVLSRTLPSDSSWSPAELHIHTNTSDGSSTPANIATLYSSAGCRVAYITDHSDGIATKTWAQYSSDVNAATITGVISATPSSRRPGTV